MSYLDLGVFNAVVALFIACCKASIVVLFFMHVKYSSKLTKLTALLRPVHFLRSDFPHAFRLHDARVGTVVEKQGTGSREQGTENEWPPAGGLAYLALNRTVQLALAWGWATPAFQAAAGGQPGKCSVSALVTESQPSMSSLRITTFRSSVTAMQTNPAAPSSQRNAPTREIPLHSMRTAFLDPSVN